VQSALEPGQEEEHKKEFDVVTWATVSSDISLSAGGSDWGRDGFSGMAVAFATFCCLV
jgi:hypothetical protein